jgi:hypothetical protein
VPSNARSPTARETPRLANAGHRVHAQKRSSKCLDREQDKDPGQLGGILPRAMVPSARARRGWPGAPGESVRDGSPRVRATAVRGARDTTNAFGSGCRMRSSTTWSVSQMDCGRPHRQAAARTRRSEMEKETSADGRKRQRTVSVLATPRFYFRGGARAEGRRSRSGSSGRDDGDRARFDPRSDRDRVPL